MSDQLDRIESKVDKLHDKVDTLNVTVAKQQVILEEHEKRSTSLESVVLPLQKKANLIEGALKLVGFLALLAGVAEAIHSLLR